MPTYLKTISHLLYDAPAPRTQDDIEVIDATITRSAGDGRIKTITFGGDGGATVTLTTTGSSGLATLIAGVLNVPNYTSASARFGYPSEDETSDADREIDMGVNSLTVTNASEVNLRTGDPSGDSGFAEVSNGNSRMGQNNSFGNSTLTLQSTSSDQRAELTATTELAVEDDDISDLYFTLDPTPKDSPTDPKTIANFFGVTKAGNIPNSDLRLPFLSGNHYVAAVRAEDDFANDAAAATGGVFVGQYYHTAGVVKIRLA